MTDVPGTADALSDDELERRLRATYARVTATTRLAGRALETPARRPVWPARLSFAMAAAVVLVLLGVVVTRRGDEAADRDDGPRWALVSLFQWGFQGVRPYDSGLDGLGEQRGDVVQYRRGDAVVSVMSLRDASIDDDRLAEDVDVGGPALLVTPDGRLAVRRMAGDLTLVLRYEGDTDAEHVPDLRYLARSAVTLGEDAWAHATRRQGFATFDESGPEPSIDYRFDDGLALRRYVSGSLRSGFNVAYRTVGADLDGSWFGAPTAIDDPILYVVSWDDERAAVLASAAITSIAVDGTTVPLDEVIDPDSGVARGWALFPVDRGVHEVVGRDATGEVVAAQRWSHPSGSEVELP